MNKQQHLSEGFVKHCYKIVPPILPQELINNFVVCKLCSGILLLVENVASRHSFGGLWNFTCEKENLLSKSSKARPITPTPCCSISMY